MSDPTIKIMRGRLLKAIPINVLNEEWAQKNHDQTLDRLAERGGIDVSEALAIIERRNWEKLITSERVAELRLMQAVVDAYWNGTIPMPIKPDSRNE